MTPDPRSLPVPASRSLATWPRKVRRFLTDLLRAPVYRLYTNRLRHGVQSSARPLPFAVVLALGLHGH
jgi:hypothetical protein